MQLVFVTFYTLTTLFLLGVILGVPSSATKPVHGSWQDWLVGVWTVGIPFTPASLPGSPTSLTGSAKSRDLLHFQNLDLCLLTQHYNLGLWELLVPHKHTASSQLHKSGFCWYLSLMLKTRLQGEHRAFGAQASLSYSLYSLVYHLNIFLSISVHSLPLLKQAQKSQAIKPHPPSTLIAYLVGFPYPSVVRLTLELDIRP